MRKMIWLTWEQQRRNWEIAAALKAKLFQLDHIQKHSRWTKYFIGAWETLKILRQEKPDVVFCQNPSIILTLLCVLLKPFFGYKLVVDVHNGGLMIPEDGFIKNKAVVHVLYYVAKFTRKYSLSIVTNQALADFVEKTGGKAFVLPDKIPNIKWGELIKSEKPIVTYICSWSSDDEPYADVIAAGMLLQHQFDIRITGNYKKKNIDPNKYRWITFTGRTPYEEYETLIASSDVIVDLTTADNCMLCGNYEAVAVERPLVTSFKGGIKEYFNRGTVFVSNHTAERIAQAIKVAYTNRKQLSMDMVGLKKVRNSEWRSSAESLLSYLDKMD